MKEIWPNFFIVGTSRSGTSALYEYLRQHPKVYMPSRKEPYYFCADIVPDDGGEPPIRSREEYLRLFNKVKDEIAIGEASTAYLEYPQAAEKIHAVVPHAKIIIMVRDPIERALSEYLGRVTIGLEKSSFTEVIARDLAEHRSGKINASNIITKSFYCQEVKRYLDVFGKDNVKILIFEEFTQNIMSTVGNVLTFLRINDDIHSFNEEPVGSYGKPRNTVANFIMTNKSVRRFASYIVPKETRQKLGNKYLLKKEEKPHISSTDRKFLENLYHDDAYNLCILLNKSLPWPLLKL
jgi:hypothetical protein